MQTPTPPQSATPTSKRKRPALDSAYYLSPSPTRPKTTGLPSRAVDYPDCNDTIASESLRTTITGHLQELDIQEQDSSISKLDFGMGKRKKESSTEVFAPQVLLPRTQTYNQYVSSNASNPVTPPSSSHGPDLNQEQPAPHSTSTPSSPTSPPTTTTHPSAPPAISTTTPNPPTPDPRLGNKSPVHTTNNNPPLLSLWWTDTEITGHNPSDPTDDGYGINGVGFVPTPAMARARAEKRRKQVREWKEREAREARARRGLRRQRGRGDNFGGGGGKFGLGGRDGRRVEEEGGVKGLGKVGAAVEEGEEGRRKEVRFSDVMEVEVG